MTFSKNTVEINHLHHGETALPKKEINELALKPNEKKALEKLKTDLERTFPGCGIVLFGSRARGEGGPYSDLDVLIIIDRIVDRTVREMITDISYPIELEFDVVFGRVIESRSEWNSPLYRSMPLHWSIDREGVTI